jgi:hypothetical protein
MSIEEIKAANLDEAFRLLEKLPPQAPPCRARQP